MTLHAAVPVPPPPDRISRAGAACLVALLHIAVAIIFIYQARHGGITSGRPDLDQRTIMVSLTGTPKTRVSAADPDTPAVPAKNRVSRALAPKEGRVAHQAANRMSQDRINISASQAVTLMPDATPAMSDPAVMYYRSQLEEYLARYTRYPMDARRNGIQGTVYLHFVLRENGEVENAWIERSSGFVSLDGEALAAIQRAQPLPAIPAGWPRTLDVTLPVTFGLS